MALLFAGKTGPRPVTLPRYALTSAFGAATFQRRLSLALAVLLALGLALVPDLAKGSSALAAGTSTSITNLTVEHRVNPLSVDVAQPRFGWQMASSVRGQRQTAYQVLVATSQNKLTASAANMWNSGRVASSTSVAVRYAGAELEPSTRYYWTVLVWDAGGKLISAPKTYFETALLSSDGTTGWSGAKWISMAGKAPNSPGAPMLRQEVPLTGQTVRDARLYVSALGVYDAYVNGQRTTVPQDGDNTIELMPPGWSNYDSAINYMTYDVTNLVAGKPRVTVAAVLGNGWYNHPITASATWDSAEDTVALKAKLLIRYTDGSTQTIATTPGSEWKATDAGPFRADDVYNGQTYDARQEMPGWTANGFDDSGWADVTENNWLTRFPASQLVAYPGETARLMPRWDRNPESIVLYNQVAGQDSSANGKGHIVVDQSRSVTDKAAASTAPMTISTGDTAIYDFGQNMVGVPRYTVTGPAGAQIQVKFGEMLNDDSAGADGPEGSVYRANLRTALQTSTYTLKGDPAGETHQDSLTFYGFRYASVTVSTPNTTVTVNDLTGKVATSAIRDIGQISTNDPLVNKLYSNIRWGQRGNYLWVPTDCPQRDERQGWTADTQVFSNTGMYNGDAVNFLSHYEQMMIESQKTYGADGANFTETAPGGAFAPPAIGLSGWADAGVVVPWTVWQMSGDSTIIDRSWPAMVKFMDWIYGRTGVTYLGPGTPWGDWLAPQGSSAQIMSDIYYAYTARLMAQMAKATNRSADQAKYERLFDNIKRAFILKYLIANPLTGELTVRSGGDLAALQIVFNGSIGKSQLAEDNAQSPIVWMLKLGLYDTDAQRQKLVDMLADNIRNDAAYKAAHPLSARTDYAENTLSVGFLGINVLAPVLTDSGREDLAYTLLHQDAMPSWMYSVKNGATTIWERWNSYSAEDGFGPVAMNSFNHYAYGAIGEWMYEDMAGIAKDPDNPGFKHFFLQPKLDPTGKINKVDASYASPYGQITSAWSVTGETFTYRVAVPANSRATLKIPTASPATVKDGSTPLAQVAGVTFLGYADGVATYRLESGSYALTSTLR